MLCIESMALEDRFSCIPGILSWIFILSPRLFDMNPAAVVHVLSGRHKLG